MNAIQKNISNGIKNINLHINNFSMSENLIHEFNAIIAVLNNLLITNEISEVNEATAKRFQHLKNNFEQYGLTIKVYNYSATLLSTKQFLFKSWLIKDINQKFIIGIVIL